jgi:DNA ligase-1
MTKITAWLCLVIVCLFSNAQALEIMLPRVYTEGINVTGWLMSEKLDGVRGYWDGVRLLSKKGFVLYSPEKFTQNFPPFPLEGELWGGRKSFEQTVSIVKRRKPHKGWLQLRFAIFDVPLASGGIIHRLHRARDWFEKHPSQFAFIIPQQIILDNQQLKAELQRVEKLGGEGLIVRKADTLYAKGRSDTILKVKSFLDMEALVVAHVGGRGKNRGRLGSLLVELADKQKTRFKIGTGFSDDERNNPPAIGSIITFKYYGFYASGIPKFPSFLRMRMDTEL